MRFNILSDLYKDAWGGGNQFQKALKNYFISNFTYSYDVKAADVILVNSHHWGKKLFELYLIKKKYPNVIILHRVDGPISIVRNNNKEIVIDLAIMHFNKFFADGTIYQSIWSQDNCLEQGMGFKKMSKVIYNAPDPEIFFKTTETFRNNKIHIIAASWSTNKSKGFDIYKFIDDNLDFSNYSFTFIGNSPIKFNNIKQKPAMSSDLLAEEFRRADLFLHPSHREACSNSLIEAMHCGLIPIAMNNTSHPEIIEYGGLLFEGVEDVLKIIDKASNELDDLHKKLNPPKIEKVGSMYFDFAKIISKQENNILTTPNWRDLLFVWTYYQIMKQKLRFYAYSAKLIIFLKGNMRLNK
tara:strand:+ start:536 stop:1597 length:1062 start_codon:yes stop_codon:yes gene_type:complete